jgi:glutaminyl-tRNA synthetase
MESEETKGKDFIREIIEEDLKTGKFDGRVHTRFPPEPNGYLHLGHGTHICLNLALAKEYGGKCNLRFDDTNPSKEEEEYVQSIIEDVKWLGFELDEERLLWSSDYFDQMYDWALDLVKKGKAYVDDQNPRKISATRGTFETPGTNSPFRDRSVDENLDLLERMKAGEFGDGERTLRAKIDMAHPNMNMRDPIMYRVLHESHHNTGDKWCLYPMYDWAHGLEDSIEGITHSICTLEFENHRPLYDWFLDELGIYHPQQIEYARFNMTYTVMSKRILRELVDDGHVSGWDDPRMPTLSGLRRRGCPPEAIRELQKRVGVSKNDKNIAIDLFEHCMRNELNRTTNRVMGVLRPLKVIIENYPEDKVEEMEAVNNPEDPGAGTRTVPFSKVLYIEQDDFMEDPPKKFWRLAPGREVRFRYAYFVTCKDVVKDENGEVKELICTIDPETKGGDAPDGRKVKSTLHWVSAEHALDAETRLYNRLFTVENPGGEEGDFKDYLNPDSLEVLKDCKVEPSVKDLKPADRVQFERLGYFCVDKDSTDGNLVFNRTVTLRDTWAKIQKQQQQQNK